MNKNDFFCLLNCYDLEKDFIEELKSVPFHNLEILGLNKLNPFEFEKNYFKNELRDVSIDPNANVDSISPNNFYMEATKSFFKLMTFHKLWKVGRKLFETYSLKPLLEGWLYFHDSTKAYVPYCVGASCLDVIQEGRPYGTPKSLPPKRSDSYVALCIEFLMDMSQEFAGAVALTDFLPGLAWYTSKEDVSDKFIENRIQSFVHVSNNHFRVGGDSISGSEEFIIRKDNLFKIVTIKDFCENFEKDWEIISFNPNYGGIEWRKIISGITHNKPSKFCKVILGSGKTINCTTDHSLYTFNQKGEIIVASPSKNPQFILTAREIDLGNTKKVFMDNIEIDEDLSWILGLYAGDGYYKSKGVIEFSLYNKILDNETMRIMEDKFNCSFRFHKGKSNKGNGGSLTCRSRDIPIGDLFKRYCKTGAKNKIVPDFILNSPRNIKLAYINGVIDSDGYIDPLKGAEIGVISKKLVDGIRLLGLSLGLNTREGKRTFEKKKKFKKEYGGHESVQQDIYRIFLPKEFWQELKTLKGNFPQDIKQHHFPYEYEWLRPFIKDFYKYKVLLKSKGSFKITTEMIDEWYIDTTQRLEEIEGEKDLDRITDILIMPKHTSYKGYYYNIRSRKGLDDFERLKEERLYSLKYLNNLLEYMQYLLPMKVREIKEIIQEEKSYDFSVEGNQNFMTINGIFAHNSPFSNISVCSKIVLKEIFENYMFPDGRKITDFIDEIMRVQKIFLEFMYKGRPDADGLPYKFPIVTANFKKTDINDMEELENGWFEYVSKLNHKGFINFNFSPRFALCCRLNIDRFKVNSYGGGGLKIGSFRVVNINLPKIALESKGNVQHFYAILERYLFDAHVLLNIEREILKEKIQEGFLKFFRIKWYNLDNMFVGTLSFHGLPDAIEYLIEKDITEVRSQLIASKTIRMFLFEAKTEKDYYINIEQAPAESATNTMSKFNNDGREFYSNQFVPLEFPLSIKERISIESIFSDMMTGGSMCFINLDSQMDREQSYKLHKYIYKNSMINQWCPNYGWTQCLDCNKTCIGEVEECSYCGSENINYFERVVGYLVNRDVVNRGREVEMLNRTRRALV